MAFEPTVDDLNCGLQCLFCCVIVRVWRTHTHSVPSVDDSLLVSATKMEVGILGSRPLADFLSTT